MFRGEYCINKKQKKQQATTMDQNPKQQAVERIKDAANILVTVSKNPTVDQLASCIGFTLLLNKLGKHATAVFSGAVPSMLEFLQPDKTLEQNTDSLRDFIIALDKSKADKLRYKVEDEVVRIFITPYKTSIGEKDLVFSQGDFNVDVVVALGVTNKEDIDQAIVAHGRILHDAVVISVASGAVQSDVGSINWQDAASSSLSEMLVSISESFQSGLLDAQMATAFLTGIVAETDRFSNEKTTPKVMTMSAQLMAAGANQQLIAQKLSPEPEPMPESIPIPVVQSPLVELIKQPNPDGEIEIIHEEEEVDNEIHIDDQGNLKKRQEELRLAAEEAAKQAAAELSAAPSTQGPASSDYLVAESHKVISPLSSGKYDPLAAFSPPVPSPEPSIQLPPVVDSLTQLEQDVHSPHVGAADGAFETPNVENARQAVSTAGLDSVPRPQASQASGAQIMDIGTVPTAPSLVQPATSAVLGVPQQQVSTTVIEPTAVVDPMSPPPVPPPMMPQYFNPQSTHAYLSPQDQPSSQSTSDMTQL